MFFLEQAITEEEAHVFVEASSNDNPLKTLIIDPIIAKLEGSPSTRKAYIQYGNDFLQANSEMLSKEFPTKMVSFPHKYIDNIFEIFGFEQKEFKGTLKLLLKQVSDKTEFYTISQNPSNVIHSIVLLYSDMIQHRQLRDSARQQLGLSVYNNCFNAFFKPPHPIEATMAYTYMNLNNSWGLVKSENVINWIGSTTETAFGFFRSKMSLDMSPNTLVLFLNRVRTSFRQNLRLLANQYYNNMDKGSEIGADVSSNDSYVETRSVTKYRQGLIRKINSGDQLYADKGSLYTGIARLKNVKVDSLYDFAQTIDTNDIAKIIDTILYVFITRDGNDVKDINSTAYISRITNFPTAIDRAISGKPIIITMTKKYKVDSSIVKAYICLIATYIMYRINDVTK